MTGALSQFELSDRFYRKKEKKKEVFIDDNNECIVQYIKDS